MPVTGMRPGHDDNLRGRLRVLDQSTGSDITHESRETCGYETVIRAIRET